MENYRGVIIEESLKDTSVLKEVEIVSTEIEKVTEEHKTPWINQWTMHTVEFPPDKAENLSKKISQSIDTKHGNWYADFKNENIHYVIYPNRVFRINRKNEEEYQEATKYGISIGIADYQVDFSDDIKQWER